MTLGKCFKELVVYFHSGAGSAVAGRDPRMEPVCFLERENTLPKNSLWKHINNASNASNGLVRFAQRQGFAEGMV
ncbi:hypothetical protein PG994_002274 [Apiospora phragmitis]|uniref:Uncharacterized protein n=1 Tax=Apiospora phragmitis TaxID=2905665 RepID=A0ABR1WVY5_9PEZI